MSWSRNPGNQKGNALDRGRELVSLPRHLPDHARQGAPALVSDVLREQILALQLPPGSVLSRVDLQRQFRLSSTPIRDALIRLQDEGLVDIFPQRATIVSRIDIARARQDHFLRRSLEIEVVRLVAEMGAERIVARLRGLIAQQDVLADAQDFDAFNIVDLDLHRMLFEAAGMADLWRLVRRHCGHVDRIRRLSLGQQGKMAQILADHRAIVAALAEHDRSAAQDAMRTHLTRTDAHWDELSEMFPGYFSRGET